MRHILALALLACSAPAESLETSFSESAELFSAERTICFAVEESFKKRFPDPVEISEAETVPRWRYLLQAAGIIWDHDVRFGDDAECWSVAVEEAAHPETPGSLGRLLPCERRLIVDSTPTKPIGPYCEGGVPHYLDTLIVTHEVGHILGLGDLDGHEDLMGRASTCEMRFPTPDELELAKELTIEEGAAWCH